MHIRHTVLLLSRDIRNAYEVSHVENCYEMTKF